MTGSSPGTGPRLITFPEASRLVRFLRREKRFSVEVEDGSGRFWAHSNNSGSMMGLLRPGSEALVSPALKPGRKLPFTLELLRWDGFWVGVNTLTPNRMLRLAWEAGIMPETAGCPVFRSEAVVGQSRLDGRFEGPKGTLWVEAKNVTLVEEDTAYFPDAATERGRKHLEELIRLRGEGHRCACFYFVQRGDARCFGPADFIDPDFARLFWRALDAGVECWAYRADVSPEGIGLGTRLPVVRRA